MGDILGFVGQIGAASISSQAAQQAQETQLAAIKQQRDFVYSQLDPNLISQQMTSADAARAKNQLALQGQIDPALLQARYASEAKMNDLLGKLGVQSGQVADQATKEALAGTPGLTDAKNKLVDAALAQLKQGATLPPDVEAQLVQSGLETSGQATPGAGGVGAGMGVGGTMLRTILGTAGVNLQMQRQKQASDLLTSAGNLDAQRQQILQGLFPALQAQQISTLSGTGGVFGTAAGAAPQAGPTGADIGNIWLARVGATNQLMGQAGAVGAAGALAQGSIWSNALGGATSSAGNLYNKYINPGGGGGGGNSYSPSILSSEGGDYAPTASSGSEGGDLPISTGF